MKPSPRLVRLILSWLLLATALQSLAQTTVIHYGDTWKYQVPTSDPGVSWRGVGFNDAGWSAGAALFGFETAVLPTPGLRTITGTSGSAQMVYLFRKTFTYSGDVSGTTFVIDQIVDDGVTYYLNGTLLGSSRHVPGAWNNAASASVGDAVEESGVLTGNATALVSGTNVLCAEVHQVGPGGSDLVYGARLRINRPALSSSAWRQENFATTPNSGNAADLADPDGDGLENFVEYAVASNPNQKKRWGWTGRRGIDKSGDVLHPSQSGVE